MKTFIHKIELVEDEEGAVDAAPYYRALIDGVNGGRLEMHLNGPNVEITVMSDDDTISVPVAWIDHAHDRLWALSYPDHPNPREN